MNIHSRSDAVGGDVSIQGLIPFSVLAETRIMKMGTRRIATVRSSEEENGRVSSRKRCQPSRRSSAKSMFLECLGVGLECDGEPEEIVRWDVLKKPSDSSNKQRTNHDEPDSLKAPRSSPNLSVSSGESSMDFSEEDSSDPGDDDKPVVVAVLLKPHLVRDRTFSDGHEYCSQLREEPSSEPSKEALLHYYDHNHDRVDAPSSPFGALDCRNSALGDDKFMETSPRSNEPESGADKSRAFSRRKFRDTEFPRTTRSLAELKTFRIEI